MTGEHEARAMLDLAARVALRAQGDVEPNPMVGAVLVRDGAILGIGHHRRFGDVHAERDALANCVERGHSPRGGTMYVTLEPCRHTGKQPPCTEALIAAGVARVVYARPDPGAESGGGAELLREVGIACEQSGASRAAWQLAQPWAHRLATGRPWVIAKWAQTMDGRVATRTGESQWISGPGSRRRVHRLRAKVDAIITGTGTLVRDDPMLTARGVARVRRHARRVLVDTLMDVPLDAALIRTAREFPTTVACAKDLVVAPMALQKREALETAGAELMGVPARLNGRLDLRMLLEALTARHGVATALLEAGPGLMGAFFSDDLVDECVIYIAPMLLGDEQARGVAEGRVAERLVEGRRFELVRIKRVGQDAEVVYRRSQDGRDQ